MKWLAAFGPVVIGVAVLSFGLHLMNQEADEVDRLQKECRAAAHDNYCPPGAPGWYGVDPMPGTMGFLALVLGLGVSGMGLYDALVLIGRRVDKLPCTHVAPDGRGCILNRGHVWGHDFWRHRA